MSDVIDMGSEREQKDRALAIELARSAKSLPITGYCYNCDESLPEGLRFCDADCRDDYQKRTK